MVKREGVECSDFKGVFLQGLSVTQHLKNTEKYKDVGVASKSALVP